VVFLAGVLFFKLWRQKQAQLVVVLGTEKI